MILLITSMFQKEKNTDISINPTATKIVFFV